MCKMNEQKMTKMLEGDTLVVELDSPNPLAVQGAGDLAQAFLDACTLREQHIAVKQAALRAQRAADKAEEAARVAAIEAASARAAARKAAAARKQAEQRRRVELLRRQQQELAARRAARLAADANESESESESESASESEWDEPAATNERRPRGRDAEEPQFGRVQFEQSRARGVRGGVVLRARMPRWVRAEHLNAKMDSNKNRLTLSCDLQERQGGFRRTFNIDESLDLSGTSVSLIGGVLEVTVPGKQARRHVLNKQPRYEPTGEDYFDYYARPRPSRQRQRRRAPAGFGGFGGFGSHSPFAGFGGW